MRIVMTKIKIRTKQLHEEKLNIVDAFIIIDVTMEINLKFIRNCENELNAEIDSMVAFGSKVEINARAVHTSTSDKKSRPQGSTTILT